MVRPEDVVEGAHGAAERALGFVQTARFQVQRAEIRQERGCFVMIGSEFATISAQDTHVNRLGFPQFPRFDQNDGERSLIGKDRRGISATRFSTQADSASCVQQSKSESTPGLLESGEIVAKSGLKFPGMRSLGRHEHSCAPIQLLSVSEPASVFRKNPIIIEERSEQCAIGRTVSFSKSNGGSIYSRGLRVLTLKSKPKRSRPQRLGCSQILAALSSL